MNNVKHVVRYLGNDGNQYVRNRALYLTNAGDDRASALCFPTITAASDFVHSLQGTFPGLFAVESFSEPAAK